MGIRPRDVVGVYPSGRYDLEETERGDREDREIARLQDKLGEALAAHEERKFLLESQRGDLEATRTKLRAAMAVVELVRDLQEEASEQGVELAKRYKVDRVLMAELPPKEA